MLPQAFLFRQAVSTRGPTPTSSGDGGQSAVFARPDPREGVWGHDDACALRAVVCPQSHGRAVSAVQCARSAGVRRFDVSAFAVGAAPPEGWSCRAGLPTVDYVPVMGVMVWPEESWDSETSPPPRGQARTMMWLS